MWVMYTIGPFKIFLANICPVQIFLANIPRECPEWPQLVRLLDPLKCPFSESWCPVRNARKVFNNPPQTLFPPPQDKGWMAAKMIVSLEAIAAVTEAKLGSVEREKIFWFISGGFEGPFSRKGRKKADNKLLEASHQLLFYCTTMMAWYCCCPPW